MVSRYCKIVEPLASRMLSLVSINKTVSRLLRKTTILFLQVMISHIYFNIWPIINIFQDHFIDPKCFKGQVNAWFMNSHDFKQPIHISIQRFIIQTCHSSIMLKHLINIKNHQSINVNSLNNVIRYINVKISSSQVNAEFLKIVLWKEVL